MTTLVRYQVEHGIATISLDSPDDRNALSQALDTQLGGLLPDAQAECRARARVLTGGAATLCRGAKRGQGAAPVSSVGQLLATLWRYPKTTIAVVNGAARAGGIGLIAAADIALGSVDATFAFSEVRIGVAPAMIAVVCQRRMHP